LKEPKNDPDEVFLLENAISRELKKEFDLAIKKETEVI
jgi:hypothetical protein